MDENEIAEKIDTETKATSFDPNVKEVKQNVQKQPLIKPNVKIMEVIKKEIN